MKINICKKTPKIKKFEKRLAEAFPNSTIKVKSCINMCKKCKSMPVAKVDGVKIKAKKIGKIIEKIEAI